MKTDRYVTIVDSNGHVHLDIGKSPGTRIEVIIIDSDSSPSEGSRPDLVTKLSGFMHEVLGKPEEDIWNDL